MDDQENIDQEYIEYFSLLIDLKKKHIQKSITSRQTLKPLVKRISLALHDLEIKTLMEQRDEIPKNYFKENRPSFFTDSIS